MTQTMDEVRYGRLNLLILHICPNRLRGIIDNSYSPTSSSFEIFLNTNIHALFHLKFRRCCCRPGSSNATPITYPQWDSLFTRVSTTNHHSGYWGDCPCQYRAITGVTSDVLDVTLCCLFLNNICQHIPQSDVNTIRQLRNNLIHSTTARVDESTFKIYWNDIEQALLSLSNIVSLAFTNDTRTALQTLKDRIFDPAELEALKKIMTDHRNYEDVKKVKRPFFS